MGYVYDSVNDRARLVGDGFGWSRFKYPLAAQEVGDNVMIVIRRMWIKEMARADVLSSFNNAWNSALYWGLSFDGLHMAAGSHASSVFNKFFGVTHSYSSSPADDVNMNTKVDPEGGTDYTKQDYAYPCGYYNGSSVIGVGNAVFRDGNAGGGYIELMNSTDFYGVINPNDPDSGEMLLGIPRNEAIGRAATYIDYIYSEELNEGVRSESWINTDSIDLNSLTIGDIDLENPKALFPVSNGWTTGVKQLNGTAETGTNWRPSSGVVGMPTHFLAHWPFPTQELVIDKIISKTGQLYA